MMAISKWVFVFLGGLSFLAYAQDFEKQVGTVKNDPKTLWGKSPTDSLVMPMMDQFVVNEIIKVKPVPGHKFNLKAFNSCNNEKPELLTETDIHCQFSKAGKYKINSYICDEANTFCKFQIIPIKVTAPHGYKSALKKHVSSNILYVPKSELIAPKSFIKNRVGYATKRAQKENKLLFIEFAAHWCPACNMLSENVFETEEFSKASENLVKLIVDVDSDISWELKEKFRVGEYPTTILATPQLSEIERVVGYRSPKAMSVWLEGAIQSRNEPIDLVISKVNQLKSSKESPQFKEEYQKKVMRLAQWHFERGELKEALALWKDVSLPEAQKMSWVAQVSLTTDLDKKIELYEKLIQEHSQDVNLARWLSDLAEIQGPKAQEIVSQKSSQALSWVENEALENTEFTKADIHSLVGEAYELSEQKELAQKQFQMCAQEYGSLAKASHLKVPRGAPMEQAFCLTRAGESKKAIEIFSKLANKYKTEFAFNYFYARALYEAGKTKEALARVSQAYEYSYGDNLVRAAILKTQIEFQMNQLAQAEKTAAQTLKKIYLPETKNNRLHHYVENLRAVLEKIQYVKLGKKEGVQ